MANFKDIMAMCLDGGSYAAISAALGCSNRDIAKTKTEVPRVLFLGLCLDFHFPKFGFYFSRRAIVQALVKP